MAYGAAIRRVRWQSIRRELGHQVFIDGELLRHDAATHLKPRLFPFIEHTS
jgi:hypothetical protein